MTRLLAALTLAAALLLIPASVSVASSSPPWNPTLCQGLTEWECALIPGSVCDASQHDGQIYIQTDTCVEVWWPKENYKPKRTRLTPALGRSDTVASRPKLR